jgi:cytochrome c oxidase subunit 2
MPTLRSPSSIFGKLSAKLLTCPIALACLSGALSAQDAVEKRWGPTPPASSFGDEFEDLFWLITALTGVSFALVLVMLIVPAIRDRAKPGKRASFDHGKSLHDKRFTAVVSILVFVVLDAWVLVIAMRDLREGYWNIPLPDDPDTYQVQVLGQQWAWNFRAAGVDDEFGTADDILQLNELTVPLDRPVSMNFTSKDVIHSLFLPDMRLKRDANPGAVNLAWFEPVVAGTFDILCAELCGYAHYQMHGKLHVLDESQFGTWEQEASHLAVGAYDSDDSEAHWAWDWQENRNQ